MIDQSHAFVADCVDVMKTHNNVINHIGMQEIHGHSAINILLFTRVARRHVPSRISLNKKVDVLFVPTIWLIDRF